LSVLVVLAAVMGWLAVAAVVVLLLESLMLFPDRFSLLSLWVLVEQQ
jgi:hypothetical protein